MVCQRSVLTALTFGSMYPGFHCGHFVRLELPGIAFINGIGVRFQPILRTLTPCSTDTKMRVIVSLSRSQPMEPLDLAPPCCCSVSPAVLIRPTVRVVPCVSGCAAHAPLTSITGAITLFSSVRKTVRTHWHQLRKL